ncbi:unnamed protein product [Heterobilharzia americana]|nr:unnamed protein product [Heterobilharzia americana]
MEHKTSTSSTSYKYQRKISLINALAKELAEIGDEINEKLPYSLESLSYLERITLIRNSGQTYKHSDHMNYKMKSNSKNETVRLLFYATPVLVLTYFFYLRRT